MNAYVVLASLALSCVVECGSGQGDSINCTYNYPKITCPEGLYCVTLVTKGNKCLPPASARESCKPGPVGGYYEFYPPCKTGFVCDETKECILKKHPCSKKEDCPELQFCVKDEDLPVEDRQICAIPGIEDEVCTDQEVDGIYEDYPPCEEGLVCSNICVKSN